MTDFFYALTNIDVAISFLKSIDWYWVLLFSLFITFLENLFPPSPSDVILLFMGSLVTLGNVSFVSLLLFSTIGSVSGFLVMYYLGHYLGDKIVSSNKISFINKQSLEKPRIWFNKYGYYVIIVNRFLSGTRAVISFLAGMSDLSTVKTVILSALSALLWNSILIYLGVLFSNNLTRVQELMNLYGKIIFPLIVGIIFVFVVSYFLKVRKSK